ncbi:MAG: phage tail protein [Methylococcaceae bacterium]|nr:phage tail protein [Methylococcaceae bacterium]
MATPFVGEIRTFAGNFAPAGWALCQGQILAIADFDVLFALIGTTYGGDGQNTFALPDFRGRIPLHQGAGQGLNQKAIGEAAGEEAVTLITTQLPVHNHATKCARAGGNQVSPVGNYWSTDPAGNTAAYISGFPGSVDPMHRAAIGITGGGQAHNNVQPYIVFNYIIALLGIFPSPN